MSDSKTAFDVGGSWGGFNGGGTENTRDFRRRFAVGDNLADAMVVCWRWTIARFTEEG